jgi:phospholipid/cholesterol/gamma-HCH transport system substrate-binding protein
MTDQLKNILIGLFVAVAVTICISLILFLDPTVGDGKKSLQVRFANVSGIAVGTRVTFGGKVVGEVCSIKEVPNARELAIDDSGKVFLYQLTLKLDSSVKLYTTDEIAMRTTGLMGERSIAILPKLSPKGTEPVLITNQILYANSVDQMENTIMQIGKVASRMQIAVDQFDTWFAANKEHISSALYSFDDTLGHAATLIATAENEQILHRAANLISGMTQTVDHVNTDGASILRNLSQISSNISSGTGTIGKFINSEDFYLRLSSVMGKVETLMTDINHYGVLFQYDKSWQRQRTKRATAMKSLDTPSEFRSYFEGEVSSIQTSLGRLTELLSRASDSQERQKVVQSEPFKRDFGSLLRQVQGLTDSIKLYNEELISSAGTED